MSVTVKIKRDDIVKILSGKDRGKKGKVIQVFPKENVLVVEGANKMFKHLRPQRRGERGQKIEFNGPIKISNVMLVCPKCDKPTRVGRKMNDKGKLERVCKKCKETIA
ncbi:50S ribosomal protein L24 [Patescibacteria group bacterium]